MSGESFKAPRAALNAATSVRVTRAELGCWSVSWWYFTMLLYQQTCRGSFGPIPPPACNAGATFGTASGVKLTAQPYRMVPSFNHIAKRTGHGFQSELHVFGEDFKGVG